MQDWLQSIGFLYKQSYICEETYLEHFFQRNLLDYQTTTYAVQIVYVLQYNYFDQNKESL